MRLAALAFGAILALVALASPVGAQELRLGAGKLWTDHALLADPAGFGAHVGLRLGRATRVRVGYEQYRSDFASRGSLCAGFIAPDEDCSPQDLRDRGFLQSLGVAVPLAAYGGGRVRVDVVPGIRLAHAMSDRRSTESDRTLSADEAMWGGDVGLEGALRISTLPLRLHVSAGVGGLIPMRAGMIVDGYTPFDSGVAWRRVEVALSYTPASQDGRVHVLGSYPRWSVAP